MSEDDFSLARLMKGVEEELKGTGDCGIQMKSNRFATPVTEADLLKKIDGAVPRATRKSIEWAVSTWHDWSGSRTVEVPPPLDDIDNESLSYWLPRFIVEVRNQKGEFYNGSTLYGLCAGI